VKRKTPGKPKGSAKKKAGNSKQTVVSVGENLVVLQEEDQQFRQGRVLGGGKQGHTIKFDDGAEEQINLAHATWRSQTDIEANVSQKLTHQQRTEPFSSIASGRGGIPGDVAASSGEMTSDINEWLLLPESFLLVHMSCDFFS
jgi:hypothetical protein